MIKLFICLLVFFAAPGAARADAAPGPYERVQIAGDTGISGVFDPSIEYTDANEGWMAYSSISAPKFVHTHIARSVDGGKSWEYAAVINESVEDEIIAGDETLKGVWRHEVPALVHVPWDTGKEWKIFWHRYFVTAPYEDEDRRFDIGWIAMRHAADPRGPWSEEVALFGAKQTPIAPFETKYNLAELNEQLKKFVLFTEPGALARNRMLYLTLTGHRPRFLRGPTAAVILLVSYNSGRTWELISPLLEPSDASSFGLRWFTGTSLVEVQGRCYLLACPEVSGSPLSAHRGTMIFEFTDIEKGQLKRDRDGQLILHKHLKPQLSGGGQSDYDEHNTHGGIVMPQLNRAELPVLWGIYNTGEDLDEGSPTSRHKPFP